jgi:hypothetical protein
MRILAAGAASFNYRQHCRDYDCGKLYSALSERKHIMEWPTDKFLMVDSGAHSWNALTLTGVSKAQARKKLPDARTFYLDYAKFISENKHKPFVFVELDCYGIFGLDYADKMYKEIMSINGNFQLIRVYHPILDGGNLSILKKWIDEGQDYIGLGNDSTYLLDKIFALTKDKIKYHGFAMTKDELIIKYPFYSCDSTTVLSAVKFGSMYCYRLWQLSKEWMVKYKMVEATFDDETRIKLGVKAMKDSEIFYTKLWEKRGITWKD